ncbi:phosphate transport system protein [Halopenitus malekzadehii]|uniref:Phosphate-specific transport system accessory protein PhoU n=1 Tax=Halopenitus malekzadehii TaxID=1267564 RepID=A0A1H6JEE2_9EURY|nr:phosphate signaling complex protein PhoU [Halopenitus malekzadehii]SEH59072.1 phosphate transport system protein [Halopenitus malekzadehii]
MPRERYQDALETLRSDVLEMGEQVDTQLETALEGLSNGAESPAQSVIEGDAAINERYLALETDCVDLFALQQPVAGDLRFVTASFKIITDLERIGDLAVNLARYARTRDRSLDPDVAIDTIGEEARSLLARSLTAYGDEDAAACRRIAADDDGIDALCQRASESVTRDLIERRVEDDPWAVERLLDDVSSVLLTIRDLERAADHAVNIAARTLYMVDGDPELIY